MYFQAGLLGVVATTFFVFGMMVGSMSGQAKTTAANQDISIWGRVVLGDNKMTPDAGAVVLLLPAPPKDLSRQDPATIRPASFEPLENPTIEWIQAQGGTVVRANVDGHFEVFGKRGGYVLLVISKTNQNAEVSKLTKRQVASLSQYFLPVDKLIENQAFFWKSVSLEKDIDLKEIVCE